MEKTFVGARRRVSTNQITLARVSPGLDLIRIGRPSAAEFASWRYVNRIQHRRRVRFAQLGLAAAGAGLVLGGAAWAMAGSTAVVGGYVSLFALNRWKSVRGSEFATSSKPLVKVVTDKNTISLSDLEIRGGLRLERMGKTGWHLAISEYEAIIGPPAIQALAQVLPIVNRWGGTRSAVSEAVRKLESLNDPHDVFAHAVRYTPQYLTAINTPLAIALEMAAHESAERAAMEGELTLLERAWREAETVAAIADGLLIPDSIHGLLAQLKDGQSNKRTA